MLQYKLILIFATILVLIFLPVRETQAKTYAYIVADARDGKILKSHNSKKIIHPASLTKMMTLYLAFNAVRRGDIRLDQKSRISKNAASEPASKFWYKPGQLVTIRYLIRASAIKSANDAATALGEAISGSEKQFVADMNYVAKKMGLTSTKFKNAHGLTQIGHYSTAKDMLILARRLMLDFPEYFNIFGRIETFASGKKIRNTNHKFLIGYKGASGIKTGYTNAAGHNLAASAFRGKKNVIGVIIGSNSSSERARKMRSLFDQAFITIPSNKKIINFGPLDLEKSKFGRRISSIKRPIFKPKGFDDLLISPVHKFDDKKNISVISLGSTSSNRNISVKIGTYTHSAGAERDMPNILLLNIDLLSNTENDSIMISGNRETGYSIFISGITEDLAENLCLRVRSRETSCNVVTN